MYSPAQQADGDLSTPARSLISSAGARTFGLAFNTHDSALPISATLSASESRQAPRAARSMTVHRAPPPAVRLRDGSRPGNVLRE